MSIGNREIIVLHFKDGTSNKFYAVYINLVGSQGGDNLYQVVTAHGPVTSSRAQGSQVKHTSGSIEGCRVIARSLAISKARKGYMAITDPSYRHSLTLEDVLAKLDTTRIVGMNGIELDTSLRTRRSSPPAPDRPARTQETQTPTADRAKRSLEL